jgi:hypothetical protein
MSNARLKVFPNGVDEDGNYTDPVWLNFDSLEQKEKYLINEYKFCKREEESHLNAIYRKDRIRTKNDLMIKRVAFAKKTGLL